MRRIILFGMKHCGKSSLGRELARRFSCAFYDLDRLIENELSGKSGRKVTIRAVFSRLGEEGFRVKEEQTVRQLSKKLMALKEAFVLSLGGRTPLNPAITDLLKGMGVNVYLKIDPAEAWRRVSRSGVPAFLSSEKPEQEFMALYREREPLYEKQADLTVQLSAAPLSRNADILQKKIEDRTDAR